MLLQPTTLLLVQGLGLVGTALATASITSRDTCTAGSQFVNGRNCNLSCGTDRPGGDLRAIQTGGINSCVQACANEPQCVTAQYVESSGWCYLKSVASQSVAAQGVDTVDCPTTTASSCSPLTTTVSGRSCTISCGQDRPGGDYKAIQATSLNACVSACANDQQCTDAQYLQSNNYCYLKSTLTDPTTNADVNSVVCSAAPAVDTSSDIDNCGAIGKKCANNQYCVSGSCVARKNLCTSTQSNTTGQCGPKGCFCWGTTEDTDFCASGQGPAKAGPCNTSRDCPNGQSCLAIRTFDGWRGVCSADSNATTCPNSSTSAKFLLLRS